MLTIPLLLFSLSAGLSGGPPAPPASLQDGGAEPDAESIYPELPDGPLPVLEVPGAAAERPEDMRAYEDKLLGTRVKFQMVPIPGGSFRMGSPADEPGRQAAEGPQREVTIEPFWMGACEVTWDEYHAFMLRADLSRRSKDPEKAAPQDAFSDAVTRPTPPYMPMDFNMGVEGYPAIAMTQFAARQYTKWLTMKTGRFHRLGTEAEWEYACRAGTTTTYSFGDDTDQLSAYAWSFENSDDKYHTVGTRKPNAWGLYDMHGNVAEWVLDGFDEAGYPAAEGPLADPVAWPTGEYPRVVRGGSWDDDPEQLRSAARRGSRPEWKLIDPQVPKSIWYHTSIQTVGFRVVRPFTPPPREDWELYWEADVEAVAEIEARQRRGER